MKFLIIINLFFSLQSFAVEFQCDIFKELPQKGLSSKRAHDSENFLKRYTGIDSDFEMAVKRICEYLNKCEYAKETDKEVRENYTKTASGKKSLETLQKLRSDFNFNAIDNYLIEKHPLNYLGPVKTTHLYKKNDRSYYINETQVVAYVDHAGETATLTRLNEKCLPVEIVSFANLNPAENPIRMKVTQNYCTSAQNKGPTFKHTAEDIRSMGAYLTNPGDVEAQMEVQELCNQWAVKPEPVGLVIDANEPQVPKTTVASTKKSKKTKSSTQNPEVKKKKKKKRKTASTERFFREEKMQEIINPPLDK